MAAKQAKAGGVRPMIGRDVPPSAGRGCVSRAWGAADRNIAPYGLLDGKSRRDFWKSGFE